MKLIKIFGLALVAAIAATAFLGVGTASAKTSLCTVNEALCAEANRYKDGERIEAESQVQGKLKDANLGIEVSCQRSVIQGEITKAQGEQQVEGKITAAMWEDCAQVKKQDPLEKGDPCIVTAEQLPWQVHIDQKEVQDGNGTMWVGPQPGGPQPAVKVDCGFLKVATYKPKETQPGYGAESVQLQITGGNPAKAEANQAELKSNLGTQGLWDAQYRMVAPAGALFVTQQ